MGKDAPDPTPPKETSAAATGTGVSTAIANSFLGNVDRVGPDGTTTYSQSGDFTWTDPYTSQTYTVPRFTETVSLSPQQQATYDASKAAELNLANLAKDQSGFLSNYLNQPVNLNNEEVEGRLFDLGSKRLDPRFEREEAGLRTQLLNRGIREGSAAFNSEMERFSQGRNDAYNQLALTGRGQAVQEALTERNQPINEITALLSGSQVSMPQFTGGNVGQIPTTDNAGIIANYDNQKLQQWQMENAQMGGLFGGLLGLGGRLIGLSDERAKEDISKVGETDSGDGIYMFRYKGDDRMQMGLMAQDVEKRDPDAIIEGPGGLKMVDYSRALSL